jgi:hypothetical protein
MTIAYEPDDLPAGYPDVWELLTEGLFRYLQYINARYSSAEWKLQHRRHARESARRARATPEARAKRSQRRRELYAARKAAKQTSQGATP